MVPSVGAAQVRHVPAAHLPAHAGPGVARREGPGHFEGRRKYEDLDQLALSLVKPGGLFVTCSCSGRVSLEEFEAHVVKAAHRLNRRLQFFDRTGPGPDHPVFSNCLDSRYLKVLWERVV